MQIVPQSATSSRSSVPVRPVYLLPPPPVRPALPAPKPVKLLSAPKIAGLLPATAQPHVRVSKVESVRKATMPLDDILRQLGPIRSREEMNAEIADMALEALQFLNGLRAAKRRCV